MVVLLVALNRCIKSHTESTYQTKYDIAVKPPITSALSAVSYSVTEYQLSLELSCMFRESNLNLISARSPEKEDLTLRG